MKTIKILLLTFLLYSCNDTVTISKEEYKQLKGDTLKPEYPKSLRIGSYYNKTNDRTAFLIELGSDGHEYVHNYHAGYDAYVAFHYPDCKKCEKRNNIKLLVFPQIIRMDTQYYVRAPRSIRPLHVGHEYLVQDTIKWLNEIVKPAILHNKIFIYNE